MGIWDKLFGDKKDATTPQRSYNVPTIKFDRSLVTDTVKADLKRNIADIHDIPHKHHKAIYKKALESVLMGRNLAHLSNAIRDLNIEGLGTPQIGEITRILHNKASVLMNIERTQKLGIARAKWTHSGAPCRGLAPGQDEKHRAANGEEFNISEGLFIDGKWTWPGREEGCLCIMRPIIKGFS